MGTNNYTKRSVFWTVLTVLSVAAILTVGWFIWSYREAWFGSTSNLSLFESGVMFLESILICLWIVFRSGLAPVSRTLFAIVASVGGLMCGIGAIAMKTESGMLGLAVPPLAGGVGACIAQYHQQVSRCGQ